MWVRGTLGMRSSHALETAFQELKDIKFKQNKSFSIMSDGNNLLLGWLTIFLFSGQRAENKILVKT